MRNNSKMINIRILGKDKSLSDSICSSVERYGDMLCKRKNIFISSVSENFEEIPNNSIVIFCSNFKNKICGKNYLAVFSSENHHAIEALNGSGNIAISCGMSAKDTLSAASITDEKRMVSLQRTIRSIDGEIIEPRDFYIKSSHGFYASLAASAVLLLLGIMPEYGFEI